MVKCQSCDADVVKTPCPVFCRECALYVCGLCGLVIDSEEERDNCPECNRRCCGSCASDR